MSPRTGTRVRLVRGRFDFSFDSEGLRGATSLGAGAIILATPLDAAAASEHHRTPIDVPAEGKRHVAVIAEARNHDH